MKYLKTYNESLNINNDRENLSDENGHGPNETNLIQSYKEKIEECILYLSELYNVSYFDPSSDLGRQEEDEYGQDTFEYSFDITTDDDIDECINAIKSSIEKIEYDLNGEVELQIEFLRGFTSGKLRDIEFDLRNQYNERTKKVKTIGENANPFIGTISLIIT